MMVSVFAQGTASSPPKPPGPPGDDGNVDDIPINLLIYPFLILGAYLGFLFKANSSK